MFETNCEKVDPNYNPKINEKFKQIKRKRKRLRRCTIVYKFIDFIIKKVYLINDNIGIQSE